MKTIEAYYMEWADESLEEAVEPFSEKSNWKGHMVKGFIQYILNNKTE